VTFASDDPRITSGFTQVSAAEVALVLSDALEAEGASGTAEDGFVGIVTALEGPNASLQVFPAPVNANAALDFPLVSVSGSGPPDPLLYHPGTSPRATPKVLLHTTRMPLACFDPEPEFDWTQVASVDFVFDASEKGSLFVADLAFVDDAEDPGPCQ